MDKEKLIETTKSLMQTPKGILAMDESNPPIGTRLDSIEVENTETNRVRYRELIVTTPKLSDFISGAILFDETFNQKMSTGILFREHLNNIGILPGIKVDKGAKDLSNHSNEKITEGLDGLRDRLSQYAENGAKFCKWRAVITINDNIPSNACIMGNAHALARYASLCQENNLVPIVEPEVLINGNHSIEKCHNVTENTLKVLFEQLSLMDVFLEGTILKPSMVISGTENTNRANHDDVAKRTIECLKLCVPKELAGIAFLSGGQSDEESTMHLNIMNKSNKSLPWRVTFSYARAIQQSALQSWLGKDQNINKAQNILSERAEKCSLASIGSL